MCGSVPNAVECARAPEQPRVGGTPANVLFVGRLEPPKDPLTALRAFADLSRSLPHRFVIAGSGSLEEALRAEADDLGIAERVDFLGFVDDPAPLYADADALIFSSRAEGLGSVLLESLAAGTPIAATRALPGPAELLPGFPTSMWGFAPVGDVSALAEVARRLVLDPPPSADRQASSAVVERSFSTKASAAAYLAVCRAVERR
jgi:glycosyltransferase involved in cell wall biosynthesis